PGAPRRAAVHLGSWGKASDQVFIAPIIEGAQTAQTGVMIAGVNPFRAADEAYLSFLDLFGAPIAGGLAHARPCDEGRHPPAVPAELDRAKTLFFTNVSHEFRTPLTLILGPLRELLADTGRLTTDDRGRLDIAHRNAQRLLKLVNTLLDFSRIEAGRSKASFQATDLAALTRDLASAFRSIVESAGMSFEVGCEDLTEPAYVDREMWEKIVLNLLSNAFKFTFDGGVKVELRRRGERIELAIRDTGIGIAAHELPKVFDRFHRVEGTRSR